jgi:penicillin amidase
MVVGSNGQIAWGFTNSEGDWADLVVIEPDPADAESYLTPDGPKKFERHEEIIHVAGKPDERLEILSTIWGPVIDTDHSGRRRALRWVAHDPEGVNMNLLHMEAVNSLEEALDLANRCGSPAQNFVVAHSDGRIAWTILGRIPRRYGFDGRLPTSWADGRHRWDGWLEPSEYPRVVNPDSGLIWTANARVVGGEMLARLGDGGYDLGARAGQIRDDLQSLDTAGEQDMLAIQGDDRAKFLERWQQLLLGLLSSQAIDGNDGRAELRRHVDKWGGRAAVDSVGFRLVREFRLKAMRRALDPLTSVCRAAQPDFNLMRLGMCEDPAWRLLSEQPPHLLDPRYAAWNDLMLDVVDELIAQATAEGGTLADYTWGKHNTARIQHPLSLAEPRLSSWLDMPREPLAGDSANMPRIQLPAAGASERMAVSPGKEQEGYFHMPCGQSGHPLSPYYRNGHSAWVKLERTPFLPGPVMNTLFLTPAN